MTVRRRGGLTSVEDEGDLNEGVLKYVTAGRKYAAIDAMEETLPARILQFLLHASSARLWVLGVCERKHPRSGRNLQLRGDITAREDPRMEINSAGLDNEHRQ